MHGGLKLPNRRFRLETNITYQTSQASLVSPIEEFQLN